VDDYNEQSQIEVRPTIENEIHVRQRRRSSLSNRPVTRRNKGIRRIARDFWDE